MSAVRTEDRTVPGRQGAIPVRDYLPAAPRAGAAPVIWLHGGGFVTGDLDTPESHRVALRLAAGGRPVRAVDYRLAPRPWGRRTRNTPPGHHYPAALDDVVDASRDFADRHGRIVLGGASAGACLAVTAAQRLGGTAGLLLCYGLFHAELPALPPSVRRRTRGLAGYRQFTPAAVYKMNVNYVGHAELLTGGAFPGGTDLTGLPPTLMLDADFDTLRASGETFAGELDAAGVPVAHAVVPHSWHGYLNRHRLNAFRFALTAMNGWLAKRDAARTGTP
ncbi:alpha/beta hydrolase fold domain-containing protein [Nocardia sp. NPDC057353]|uniref:alpha/beta hydrolase fold domain-containing protein n=1 Tax=Nocardia sp. NPDC057353 TaxID=3346104 RepID=UPI00363CC0B6